MRQCRTVIKYLFKDLNCKFNLSVITDKWNPPSPLKPWNPWKPLSAEGSVLCPCGRGGTLLRGSCCFSLFLPYKGITFSLEMAALQTGHNWRDGRVSSQVSKNKKTPHQNAVNTKLHKQTYSGMANSKGDRTSTPLHLSQCLNRYYTQTLNHLSSLRLRQALLTFCCSPALAWKNIALMIGSRMNHSLKLLALHWERNRLIVTLVMTS